MMFKNGSFARVIIFKAIYFRLSFKYFGSSLGFSITYRYKINYRQMSP